MEKIINVLRREGPFGILADERNNIIRLWTLSFPFTDGRKLRALRRFFPNLEVNGEIIRLGGYSSLAEAQRDVAEAKMRSCSKNVNSLYRFDTSESILTIKNYC